MKLPDGPSTPPFIQRLQWIAQPLEFLEACHARYGDIFTVRRKKFPQVFLCNPQAIEQLYTADPPKVFTNSQMSAIIQPLLGQNSVNMLNGDHHQQRRRLLMPPFHGERMRAYGKLICEIAEQVMSQWTIGEPFCVYSSMQEITLRVILSAVFGLHEGQRFAQLRQLLTSLLDYIGSPLSVSLLYFPLLQRDLGPKSPWGRFVRLRQQIDQLLYAEIQQRREQPDSSRTDILTLLMSARDEAGQPLTDVELRDELITLLFAGHETTAAALAWALYWIDHRREVRNRLLRELDTLAHEKDPSAITQLPYLTAVCQETLRIYPVASITEPRILKSPLKLMGYQFAPGTVLVPCIYLIHQRQDLYPEPKRFLPERFLERQFSPYEYLPFGGGYRRCIGSAFAQFEMKLVLATIVREKQLALTHSRPVKPVRRTVTLAPPSGMQMVVIGQRCQKTLVRL